MGQVIPADSPAMNCSQCGTHTTIMRGEVALCGACSISADWQEIIHLVQDARVETPVAGRLETVPRSA